ncbi:MAG: tetratricopeptide repeat protein [Tenacibaculum sp.]
MNKLYYILILFIVLTILNSCSVKKDNFINRNYHSLTTQYNILFNGEQAFLKGLKEIEDNYKDDFWKRIQIEPITFDYNTIEAPKFNPGEGFDAEQDQKSESFSNFDYAEEKAVKAIQTHSMNIDEFEKNSKIDEAYLLLGKARYYTQRFIPAIEAFNYVISNYPKASLIYDTKIWRAKANIRLDNEKLAIETLNLLIELDKNEKNLSNLQRERAYTAMAMAYEKTDTIQKVINYLSLASKTFKNKEQSARNMFILGQIYSELGKIDSASIVFKSLAHQKKAPQKYRIRAEIELAKNTKNDSASALKALNRLKKLIKNTDNRKFLNALYYQAGVIQTYINNTDKAIEYFKKSLQAKHNNDYQKTFVYEQLGNMAFSGQNYVLAGLYYDSLLNKTSEEYYNEKRIRKIKRKNKGLTILRKYEQTLQLNDSILRLTALSEEKRRHFFKTYIEKIKKEDEEKRQQLLNSQNFGLTFTSVSSSDKKTKKGKWYFYNSQNIDLGKLAFKKLWGNRALEDNWRLTINSNAAINDFKTAEFYEDKKNPRYELASYLEAIPTSTQQIEKIRLNRNEALFQLGLIYKEQYKNLELAVAYLERLLKIDNKSQSELAISYHLYQIYDNLGQTNKATHYKQYILSKYPTSRFAKIIKNPKYKLIKNKQLTVMQKKYKQIYLMYKLHKYKDAVDEINKLAPTVKNYELIPKLALLKALSIGKYQKREKYIEALEFVSLSYADTEAGKKATNIIEQLNNNKQ